jgi:hypothetical protein
MNDHLKSIDEHLKSLDDKFQAVVELKGLLKNAPDLNQDIKVIGQETKGTHDDVVRLQERMELSFAIWILPKFKGGVTAPLHYALDLRRCPSPRDRRCHWRFLGIVNCARN